MPFYSAPIRPRFVFALVILFGVLAFGAITASIVTGHPYAGDQATFHALRAARTAWLDQIEITLTECGDAPVVWIVTLAGGGWLIWRRAWRSLAFGILAEGGAALINTIIKLDVHRSRPSDLHYSGADLYSFPSGHSTTNLALYGCLVLILWRQWPLRRLAPLAAGLALFVGAIALSRVYLGAHWLTDVGGGLVLASTWLSLLSLFYFAKPAADVGATGLLATMAIALVIAAAAEIGFNHTADLARYAIFTPLPSHPNP